MVFLGVSPDVNTQRRTLTKGEIQTIMLSEIL